jgi:N-acetylglutamate synthase-like GNAT family acetyltransferase
MRTRQARLADIPAIHQLIEHYVAEGILLPRDEDDIRRHLRGFIVAVEDGKMAGCVSLEWYNPMLAEVRSLAVDPALRGRGLGVRLVKAALDLGDRRRIARVFALTSVPEFFLRQGFSLSTRHSLHEKIDRDCIHCSKAQTCKLAAVVVDLAAAQSALNVLHTISEPVSVE